MDSFEQLCITLVIVSIEILLRLKYLFTSVVLFFFLVKINVVNMQINLSFALLFQLRIFLFDSRKFPIYIFFISPHASTKCFLSTWRKINIRKFFFVPATLTRTLYKKKFLSEKFSKSVLDVFVEKKINFQLH